mgnify:CR=1 FL=1
MTVILSVLRIFLCLCLVLWFGVGSRAQAASSRPSKIQKKHSRPKKIVTVDFRSESQPVENKRAKLPIKKIDYETKAKPKAEVRAQPIVEYAVPRVRLRNPRATKPDMFRTRWSLSPVVGAASSTLATGASFISLGRVESTSYQMGLRAGAHLEYRHMRWGFETGVMFQQNRTGLELLPGGASSTIFVEQDLDYVYLPILAKIYFSNHRESTMYFRGGLMAGMLLFASSDATVSSSGTISPSEIKLDNKDAFQNYDISAIAGFGFQMNVSPKMYILGSAEIYRGLTDIAVSGEGSIYTMGLVFMTGLKIDI